MKQDDVDREWGDTGASHAYLRLHVKSDWERGEARVKQRDRALGLDPTVQKSFVQ